ncbi:MAG: hypothetical protein JO013_16050 [Alphaproteobacteria bacterium]|nr:hypothetical protein [Alphaproteobacteria bacterium]
MKMPSLFVAAAGAALLGAAPPPPMDRLDGPPGASGGYPPCSAAIRDGCIQLYERGVATPRNLAANERLGPGRTPRRFAYGPRGPMGPRYGEPGQRRVVVVARNDYPPCGAEIGDRCIQAPAAAPAPAGYASAPRRVALRAHYDRHLVRVGERG